MSNFWETRYRLLLERLEEDVNRLRDNDVATPGMAEDRTVRLVAAAAMLLQEHRVNKRGRCRVCGLARWNWRFWYRRPRCTVYRVLGFVTDQGMDVVWWQLFQTLGRNASLAAVRVWIAERERVARMRGDG